MSNGLKSLTSQNFNSPFRGGHMTAATVKMELFVIIVNCWKPLTIIIKSSILDVASVLDPPLPLIHNLLADTSALAWLLVFQNFGNSSKEVRSSVLIRFEYTTHWVLKA